MAGSQCVAGKAIPLCFVGYSVAVEEYQLPAPHVGKAVNVH